MLEALEIVRRIEPCSAPQLAQKMGVQIASARTYLTNLRALGFVCADGCNRWAKWRTCKVAADIPQIIQVSSVWEYAARCQQEVRV
jgi:DNA-binding IclR family transcriptional regulator